jgi:hypothetical protein
MKTKIALFYRNEYLGITSSHPYGEIVCATVGNGGMIGEVEIDLMTGRINLDDLVNLVKKNESLQPHIFKWMATKELEPFSRWENI